MRHVEDIAILVKTLRRSSVFHALVVQSPPGWAKGSTVEHVLTQEDMRS